MNEQAVPNEAGGFLFEFRGNQGLGQAILWLPGVTAAVSGVVIAVIGSTSNPLFIPLGIAFAVLGVVLLIAYALDKPRKQQTMKLAHGPAQAGKQAPRHGKNERREGSLASDLALLADLFSRGALSQREFDVAKRRILGD
jgi:predicted signal transduction protein with EAL and GGDEF domain